MALVRVKNRQSELVFRSVLVAVGLLLLAWVLWSTVVGFGGGVMPIFGWHTRGRVSDGLVALFGIGGLAVGIFAIVMVVGQWIITPPRVESTRSRARSPRVR
jgi:hypothetical protein